MRYIVVISLFFVSSAVADPVVLTKEQAAARHDKCVAWLMRHPPGGMKRAYSAFLTGCMFDLGVDVNR